MAEQAGNSDLILENREKLTVTGVRRVLQCNAESAAIETARGVLQLAGAQLNVTSLDLDSGEVKLTGRIDTVEYTAARPGRLSVPAAPLMAPALVPALIGQEAAACALLGLVLGSVRAVFPVRGRAAFLPDMALVGAVLLGLQSYAAALSAGGVLRWYMPGSAFLCAFGAERLLRPALQALEQGLFWLAAGPLRLARRALQPLAAARKNRVEQARARRAQKRSAKKPKKNLPSTRRLLYNSNVSK